MQQLLGQQRGLVPRCGPANRGRRPLRAFAAASGSGSGSSDVKSARLSRILRQYESAGGWPWAAATASRRAAACCLQAAWKAHSRALSRPMPSISSAAPSMHCCSTQEPHLAALLPPSPPLPAPRRRRRLQVWKGRRRSWMLTSPSASSPCAAPATPPGTAAACAPAGAAAPPRSASMSGTSCTCPSAATGGFGGLGPVPGCAVCWAATGAALKPAGQASRQAAGGQARLRGGGCRCTPGRA